VAYVEFLGGGTAPRARSRDADGRTRGGARGKIAAGTRR
jgi:hypothetical protein